MAKDLKKHTGPKHMCKFCEVQEKTYTGRSNGRKRAGLFVGRFPGRRRRKARVLLFARDARRISWGLGASQAPSNPGVVRFAITGRTRPSTVGRQNSLARTEPDASIRMMQAMPMRFASGGCDSLHDAPRDGNTWTIPPV
jgi:hypothetical protein